MPPTLWRSSVANSLRRHSSARIRPYSSSGTYGCRQKSSKPLAGSMRAICPTVTTINAPTLSKYDSLRIARSAATARSGRSNASNTSARGRISCSSSSSPISSTGSSHRSSVRTTAPSCFSVNEAPSSRSSIGPCPITATKLFAREGTTVDFAATDGRALEEKGCVMRPKMALKSFPDCFWLNNPCRTTRQFSRVARLFSASKLHETQIEINRPICPPKSNRLLSRRHGRTALRLRALIGGARRHALSPSTQARPISFAARERRFDRVDHLNVRRAEFLAGKVRARHQLAFDEAEVRRDRRPRKPLLEAVGNFSRDRFHEERHFLRSDLVDDELHQQRRHGRAFGVVQEESVA